MPIPPEKIERLPVQISQWLEELNNTKHPFHIRSNYRLMLLNVSDVIQESIAEFDKKNRPRS